MSLFFWRRKPERLNAGALELELDSAKREISQLRSAHDLARNRLDVMVNATIVEHPHCWWCGVPLGRNSAATNANYCCKRHMRSQENRREHLTGVPIRTCPNPEKLAISQRGTAIRHAIVQGQYFYECRCGIFHLSSSSNQSAVVALASFRGKKAEVAA